MSRKGFQRRHCAIAFGDTESGYMLRGHTPPPAPSMRGPASAGIIETLFDIRQSFWRHYLGYMDRTPPFHRWKSWVQLPLPGNGHSSASSTTRMTSAIYFGTYCSGYTQA